MLSVMGMIPTARHMILCSKRMCQIFWPFVFAVQSCAKTVIIKNPLTNVSEPNPFSAPAGGACLPQSRRSPEELAEAAGAADAAARAD